VVTKKKIKFPLKVVEIKYEISGPKLKSAIERAGIRQIDLANACGFTNQSRICHLVNRETSRVSGSKLKPLIKALEEAGVEVDGFHG
jgi:predicted XRE-type DNA-binding protein